MNGRKCAKPCYGNGRDMPLTFLSHQAPVVAMKLAWPRRLDGVALVVGSMAPDFPYVLYGTRFEFDAHAGGGFVAFAVPVSALLAWLLRTHVAAVVFTLLPSSGALRLCDWRVLGTRRPPYALTVVSAALGALSHSLWDTFTHDQRTGARLIPALRTPVFTHHGITVTVARMLQYTGHIVGAVVTLALLRYVARERLLARWYGEAVLATPVPEVPAMHRRMFAVALAVAAVTGAAWGAGTAMSCLVLRVAATVGVALLMVTFALRGHPAYQVRVSEGA